MNWLHRVNYMKDAKYWLVISLILTVMSLGSFGILGFNKGIDFTGGFMFDVHFDQAVTQADVATAVEKAVGANTSVQAAEVKTGAASGAEFFVRTPELSDEQRTNLFKAFDGLGKYTKIGEEQVSGTVSKELTQQAIMAVLLAAVLQIIYLWFRFELKFGVTAVVALLHDTIITIGMVSLLKVQINSAFVAAILTILGYSINDTVIVFDRIRENLGKRRKNETLAELTTRSIQEVITRSIYTVLTVLFTLVAMLIWGGDSIKDFSLTLFIGITSGMYSSIFIAAALWVYWQDWDDKRHKAQAKRKPARA